MMNVKQFKTLVEKLGFGVSHVRRNTKRRRMTAYIACKHKDLKYADVTHLWYGYDLSEGSPVFGQLALFAGARFVGYITIADGVFSYPLRTSS